MTDGADDTRADITRLLNQGGRSAEDDARLYASVYEELRRTAQSVRGRWSGNETLSATALVHEAWMRLDGGREPSWDSRKHFYVVAARAMRQILLNYAEKARALKRQAPPDAPTLIPGAGPDELLALHEALARLEAANERYARVVELRFFADLSYEEIAEELGVSVITAKRDWAFARSLMARWLDGDVS